MTVETSSTFFDSSTQTGKTTTHNIIYYLLLYLVMETPTYVCYPPPRVLLCSLYLYVHLLFVLTIVCIFYLDCIKNEFKIIFKYMLLFYKIQILIIFSLK